jgi:hypothetical protein
MYLQTHTTDRLGVRHVNDSIYAHPATLWPVND